MMAKLTRRFTQDLFKDSEGRFKTRWEREYIPEFHSHSMKATLPPFPVVLDPLFKPAPERVFDFSLPEGLCSLEPPLQIWALADGFFSVNQVWVPGPICVLPNAVFQWHVDSPDEVQEHHLELAKILRPKPEYIIIGTGKRGRPVLSEGVIQKFRIIGVNVEYCATFEACGTFNLTSDDRRQVCAFIFPHDVV